MSSGNAQTRKRSRNGGYPQPRNVSVAVVDRCDVDVASARLYDSGWSARE